MGSRLYTHTDYALLDDASIISLIYFLVVHNEWQIWQLQKTTSCIAFS